MDWTQVVLDLGPRLLRYFSCRYSDPVASDLVQDTLIRLVQKVRDGAFDPGKGNLAGYAFGIAHFINLEWTKKHGGDSVLTELGEHLFLRSSESSPEEMYAQKQSAESLRRAIAELSPTEQQVMMLLIDE